MHTRPETRQPGSGTNPSDGCRPWLLLALGATLLGGALATPAAAAPKACTKSCTAPFRACLAGARQERAALRAACTAGAGRRACRTRVGVASRAEARACRALRRQCRACCRSSGQSCDQPPVVRDDSHAANGLVTTAGGSVTATGADGTTYTLEVPAGALPDDATITLTPLTAVGGVRMGKGIVAGVHAEPSGLQFVEPATLTIALPRAPVERLVGFLYDGEGTDLGATLVVTEGATARLRVTHFSGFGVGPESSPELRAILARSSSAASQRFGSEFTTLSEQGVRDRDPYLDVLRRWFRQVVRPALAGAVGSDPRLRQALRDYDHWLGVVQQGSLALGLALDLDTPTTPEQAEATGLIAVALRDAVARADARCLAQHSLAEAETALEWQVIAAAADVDTPANALDLDTVLDGLCVEARYDDVLFPAEPPIGILSELQVRVGLAFIDDVPASDDPMDVEIDPHGTVEQITIGGDTDPTGLAAFEYTPLGDRELRLDIHSCGHVPGRRRLKRVCQDAFVVRGLEVDPPTASVPPGGQQEFRGLLFGQPTADVTWSAAGGTIDPTGRFTAGNQTGTFAVRATSTIDGSFATATVAVGGATTSTTTIGSTTTTTSLPPTGTVTFSVNAPRPNGTGFIGEGTFNVSITDTGGGTFATSVSWVSGSLLLASGCRGEVMLNRIGQPVIFEVSPSGRGGLSFEVADVDPFHPICSNRLTIGFSGPLLAPNLVQFNSVCFAGFSLDCFSASGVVQIGAVP